MYARNAANAYTQVGMQTAAMDATPHKLIAMLYEGARGAIARARFQMEAGDIPAKGKAISHAINIIDNGLRAALDHEAGGATAGDLEVLYDYMSRRLLLANLRNDATLLAEVDGLLEGLASAWAQIEGAAQPASSQPVLVEG